MKQAEFEALQVLAYFYLRNARPEKSVIVLDALTALRPENLDVRRSLALAQIRAGDGENALETLDQLAMLGNTDECFHLMRSEALSLLRRSEEAAAAMRAYLSFKKTPAKHGRAH